MIKRKNVVRWTALAQRSAHPDIVLAHLFMTLAYCVSSVAVLLLRSGPRLDEAASSLGATPWSAFRRVTLPMIQPGLFAGFFFAFHVHWRHSGFTLHCARRTHYTSVAVFQALQFDFEQAVLAVSTISSRRMVTPSTSATSYVRRTRPIRRCMHSYHPGSYRHIQKNFRVEKS